MNTQILRRYRQTVVVTFLGVIALSLLLMLREYYSEYDEAIERVKDRNTEHSQNFSRQMRDNIHTLHSLRQHAMRHYHYSRVKKGQMIGERALPCGSQEYFCATPQSEKTWLNNGLITSQNSLTDRSDAFYRELAMLQKLSESLPLARSMAPNALEFRYLSTTGLRTVYPWPESGTQGGNSQDQQQALFDTAMNFAPSHRVHWGGTYQKNNGQWVTALGLPVYLEDEYRAQLSVELGLVSLTSQLARYNHSDHTILLLDEHHHLLAFTNDRLSIALDSKSKPQIKQVLPRELQSFSVEQLLTQESGQLLAGYFVQSISMVNTPWHLLYIYPEQQLESKIWHALFINTALLIIVLSLVVGGVHYLTRRGFIQPTAQLVAHLENSALKEQKAPTNIEQGWEPWFDLISRVFAENRQYTDELLNENKKLDQLIAEKTATLDQEVAGREWDSALKRGILDTIPDCIVVKDRQGRYLGCNKAAQVWFDKSEEALIGTMVDDLLPEPQGAYWREYDRRILQEKTPARCIEKMLHKGEWRHIDTLRLPFYDQRGTLLGLIVYWRDITYEHQRQEQLRLSEERYQFAMNAVEDGVWDWDQEFGIHACTPTYYTMLGYDKHEYQASSEVFDELLHPNDRERVKSYIEEYWYEPRDTYQIEFRLRHKDGSYRWILSRAKAARFNANGRAMRLVGTHKDITWQKENEAKMLEAKQEAELANRTKSEFLANMSHEIRTPMNAILGMLQLVLRSDLTDAQRDRLEKAQFGANSLLKIINDVLDFSKVEAGKLTLERAIFSLKEVLDHALTINSIKAEEKGIRLFLSQPIDPELTLIGDPLRLGQVLINLLANAVKFTEQGEVELKCETLASSEGRITLRFTIKDTGIGIAQEKLACLFDAFSQADSSTTREFGGTGLGLSISQHLVTLMGGEIRAHSELGKGTTFRFRLDMEQAAMGAKTVDVEAALDSLPSVMFNVEPLNTFEPTVQHKVVAESNTVEANAVSARILLAEDNLINQQIASELLTSAGYEVTVVDNGQLAVEQALTGQFDLVLMDIQMPIMDGLEATKTIRLTQPTLPIVAMTAHARVEDKQKSHDAGMNAHITKPIMLPELFATLNLLLAIEN